jgi:hypothetical protein
METPHKFLRYRDERPPSGEVAKIAAYVLNQMLGCKNTVSRYRKAGVWLLKHSDPNGIEHQSRFRFTELVEAMQVSRRLEIQRFNLPEPFCSWLESPGLVLQRNFHVLSPTHDAAIALELQIPYGNEFPIKPRLDREGVAFASFQQQIQTGIVSLFHFIVENSQLAVTREPLWINALRMLINERISLVDITMHQLYFAAQYKLNPAWKFDEKQLAKWPAMRINDKLKWVGMITGKPLDNAQKEVERFDELRHVRNHFSHFDPPCVVISVEDAERWLNSVPSIAMLLWKIREKLDVQLSLGLIEMLLLPRVQLAPRNPTYPRFEQTKVCGYASSIWVENNDAGNLPVWYWQI